MNHPKSSIKPPLKTDNFAGRRPVANCAPQATIVCVKILQRVVPHSFLVWVGVLSQGHASQLQLLVEPSWFPLPAILPQEVFIIGRFLKRPSTHLDSGQEWRHACGGLVVVSANAGGAWSPIGDVTTTMLWIQHKAQPDWCFSPTLASWKLWSEFLVYLRWCGSVAKKK